MPRSVEWGEIVSRAKARVNDSLKLSNLGFFATVHVREGGKGGQESG